MITIQIVKWRQYVARSDLKNVPWLKLSEKMVFDQRLYNLTAEQKWTWIFLLTEGARQNDNGTIKIDLDCLASLAQIKRSSLEPLLQHLAKYELIEIVTDSEQLQTQTITENPGNNKDPCHRLGNVTQQNTTEPKMRLQRGKRAKGPLAPLIPEVVSLSDDELSLGSKWLDMASHEMPHKVSDPNWTVTKFAHDLVNVKNAIGYTDEQMKALFNWVSNSEFWRPNACAPIGLLRKKDNDVRKIDTIIAQMKNPFDRKRDITRELTADPNRPTKSGISLNRIRELQGLPPIEEN
jgi:hypothetical protein